MLATGRERLEVRFQDGRSSARVGTLALVGGRLYFEYADEWIQRGLELSPFVLPLAPGPIEHTQRDFGPLFGLFDDSLPDGWGLLLMDRFFRSQGVSPERLTILDRLAYLGTRTMGALTYHPPTDEAPEPEARLDLALLASEAREVLAGHPSDVLPQLLRAGGSPGGARPKVLVGYHPDRDWLLSGEGDLPPDFQPWIVKFQGAEDAGGAGPLEYAYSQMARAAGLLVPETRLFEAASGQRYFGVRRFDRTSDGGRFHVHTFGNLIQANFRIPCCDYEALLKASFLLCRDRRALLAAYRQAAFNVAAHNRDDHAKNFAFRLDADTGVWSLAPSYDLTCSAGPGGQHTTTVSGEGQAPGRSHLLQLARRFDLADEEAGAILDEVSSAVARWAHFAELAGVGQAALGRVGALLGLS